MVKHIVLFKLKESAEGAGRAENARRIVRAIESLRGRVPGVVSLEAGINLEASPAAYDVAMVSAFATRADLDAYQAHPAHREVVELITRVREARVVVDYEV